MLNELQNEFNEEINNNYEDENNNEEKENISNSNNSLQNVIKEDILNISKNINVFCRFRPPNEAELSHSTNNCLILLSPKKLIFTQEKNLEIKKEYTFDGLFDFNKTPEIFYAKSCKPMISKFLLGYNTSIICYGETGTGKTFTIKEIIPLIVNQIFSYINESDTDNELFKIELSSIEIFKEQINDLINPSNKNLNLIQNDIDNLTNVSINSSEQMISILNEVINLRNKKQEESKSHFIIRIILYHYIKQKNCIINSKLFISDLEGSERLSNNNKLNEEQKLINKSLVALSIIVNNLSSGKNYIPYRDSKLTQILSESFGGNCYTSLILTCSKHELSSLETRNTLMFGEKARNIENNPVLNIQKDINKKNHNLFLSEIAEDENENLYESINNNRNSNNINNISEEEKKFMKIQINQLKEIIEQDKIYIEELNERNKILESEKKNLMDEFEKLINIKREEDKKDTINSEYIESNINDLHQLLNEKELNEKKLNDEINNMKLILEKNKMEISELINNKNEEILKIKQEQNNQIQTFQELINCLEQASNQIQTKDKKIEELLSIIQSNKDNNLKIQENNDIPNNKESEDIIKLKQEIQKMNEMLQDKDEQIKKLNEEKNILIKKKSEYDNRLSGMTKLVNKMKEELNKQNINITNNQNEVENKLKENNILKNKIQSLENNINILTKAKSQLEESQQKMKEEFNSKYNTLKNESQSKLEELQNEIDTKNKISIEFHNLKIKYQNLLKNSEQIQLNNKNVIEKLKQEINELKNNNELITIENNKQIEKLKIEINSKENLLEENKLIHDNELKEVNSYKNLISKLKKENASLNNIINDLKSKIENEENITKNYFNKLSNLETKLQSKEYLINDYKTKYEQILKKNLINKNSIKELEENNKTLLTNLDIMKNELNNYENEKEKILIINEEYNKEIEKYKLFLTQKDDEINQLNEQIITDKISLDKILSLQKEISELRMENNQLKLIIEKNKNNNNKKEPVVYLINKEMNLEKIKNAYKTLIEENEQLKNNIMKLKEYHH